MHCVIGTHANQATTHPDVYTVQGYSSSPAQTAGETMIR